MRGESPAAPSVRTLASPEWASARRARPILTLARRCARSWTMPAAKRVKDEVDDVKPELEVRLRPLAPSDLGARVEPSPPRCQRLTRSPSAPYPSPHRMKGAIEAPPPGAEQLHSALRDFLAQRKSPAHLSKLLALLNPINLRAGALAGKYRTPQWSDDNTTPPQLRAHWRAQACALLHCKESEIPDPVTTALRGFLWPAALDTQRADRLAWLVKVPAFVTRSWRAAADAVARADDLAADDETIDAIMDGDGGGGAADGDAGGGDKEILGVMRVAADPFAPPEKRTRHFLELDPSLAAAHRIPTRYDMAMTQEDQPIHVFSDVRENTAAAAAAAAARAAAAAAARADAAAAELPSDDFVLEGRVSEKFDVRPASLSDEAYRQVSLRRMEEATRKTRVMQDAKGPQRVVPLPKARNLVARLDGKDPAEKVRHERMEKAQLEDKLMGLFERRNLWSFKQLVEETRQPAVWLKEVLSELAVLNRRGPNTGQWTLKDMYKKKGAGGVVE